MPITPQQIQAAENLQHAAAHDIRDQVRLVAGPGTGKTRTLVERIIWLITEKSVLPRTILAVTFSNRATREMAERVEAGEDTTMEDLMLILNKTFDAVWRWKQQYGNPLTSQDAAQAQARTEKKKEDEMLLGPVGDHIIIIAMCTKSRDLEPVSGGVNLVQPVPFGTEQSTVDG